MSFPYENSRKIKRSKCARSGTFGTKGLRGSGFIRLKFICLHLGMFGFVQKLMDLYKNLWQNFTMDLSSMNEKKLKCKSKKSTQV